MTKFSLLVLGALLVATPAAAAQHAAERANALSQEIASPFCPGVTLHECPSQQALRLRDRIEAWFEDGLSREQVLARLEDEYGPGIHAAPATEGAGLAAWLLPGLVAAVGLLLAFVLVRRWSTRKEILPAADLDEPEQQRVEEELALLRGKPTDSERFSERRGTAS